MPLAGLLRVASVATAGVGLWLWAVIALVLPARDPVHIDMWRIIAGSFLAYSGLTWAILARGASSSLQRWVLLTSSVAAIAAGSYGMVETLTRAGGGHFEGYLLLVGLVLAAHGVTGLLYYGARAARSRRPAGAPPDPSQ